MITEDNRDDSALVVNSLTEDIGCTGGDGVGEDPEVACDL